jgi:hypothetical protein
MVSSFGTYQGYSKPIYDGTQRTSENITMSDWTRLAYDLIIPSRKGIRADKPLPVFFQYTAGSRIRITIAFTDAGNFDTPDLHPAPTLQLLRDGSHPSYLELPVIP